MGEWHEFLKVLGTVGGGVGGFMIGGPWGAAAGAGLGRGLAGSIAGEPTESNVRNSLFSASLGYGGGVGYGMLGAGGAVGATSPYSGYTLGASAADPFAASSGFTLGATAPTMSGFSLGAGGATGGMSALTKMMIAQQVGGMLGGGGRQAVPQASYAPTPNYNYRPTISPMQTIPSYAQSNYGSNPRAASSFLSPLNVPDNSKSSSDKMTYLDYTTIPERIKDMLRRNNGLYPYNA